jgi:hypothetical protein
MRRNGAVDSKFVHVSQADNKLTRAELSLSAYVSIRQHTSAYVSIRQADNKLTRAELSLSAYVQKYLQFVAQPHPHERHKPKDVV